LRLANGGYVNICVAKPEKLIVRVLLKASLYIDKNKQRSLLPLQEAVIAAFACG
jgi:hypothetical protein